VLPKARSRNKSNELPTVSDGSLNPTHSFTVTDRQAYSILNVAVRDPSATD